MILLCCLLQHRPGSSKIYMHFWIIDAALSVGKSGSHWWTGTLRLLGNFDLRLSVGHWCTNVRNVDQFFSTRRNVVLSRFPDPAKKCFAASGLVERVRGSRGDIRCVNSLVWTKHSCHSYLQWPSHRFKSVAFCANRFIFGLHSVCRKAGNAPQAAASGFKDSKFPGFLGILPPMASGFRPNGGVITTPKSGQAIMYWNVMKCKDFRTWWRPSPFCLQALGAIPRLLWFTSFIELYIFK